MTTSISVHHVKSICASTVQGGECSPHFTINWQGDEYGGSGMITLYLKDTKLNERFIAAINEISRTSQKESV